MITVVPREIEDDGYANLGAGVEGGGGITRCIMVCVKKVNESSPISTKYVSWSRHKDWKNANWLFKRLLTSGTDVRPGEKTTSGHRTRRLRSPY